MKTPSRVFEDALELIDLMIKRFQKRLVQPIGLHGELEILHLRDGEVIDRRYFGNVITKTGMAEVAGIINEDTSGGFTYIAIGIGVVAEDFDDTALGSEIVSGGGERASATCSRVTTTWTNDTAQMLWTWTFSASFAVTESGVFDAASTGVMLCRKTFSAINVASSDQIQVTWKVQVS